MRFDGTRFFDVPNPFKGIVTAWAHPDGRRLYGEVEKSTARVWSRGSGDDWTVLTELATRLVHTLAQDEDGAVWIAGRDVWYLPATGEKSRVVLPDEFLGSHFAGLYLTGSTAWVTAWGNKYRVFTSRPLRATGHRVLPGEDACAAR